MSFAIAFGWSPLQVLFEETKKLMQYEPKLVDFPNTVGRSIDRSI